MILVSPRVTVGPACSLYAEMPPASLFQTAVPGILPFSELRTSYRNTGRHRLFPFDLVTKRLTDNSFFTSGFFFVNEIEIYPLYLLFLRYNIRLSESII